MADDMLDMFEENDPLIQYVLQESRALAAQEAARRLANAVPRPPSLTVRQAWLARQAARPSMVEGHACRPERVQSVRVRGIVVGVSSMASDPSAKREAANNRADERDTEASASDGKSRTSSLANSLD